MPCNSEHCEPRAREAESHEVAKHIMYVAEVMGHRPTSVAVREAACTMYGDEDLCDQFTAELCELLGQLNKGMQETVIYDGRNPRARALADWWDRHLAHDEAREAALFKNVQRDPEQVFASLKDIKEIQEALDNNALTEEDIAEEARKLCEWIDKKVLDSQVT